MYTTTIYVYVVGGSMNIIHYLPMIVVADITDVDSEEPSWLIVSILQL